MIRSGAILAAAQLAWAPVVCANQPHDAAELEECIRGDLEHLGIDGLDVEALGWEITLTGTVESRARTRQAVNCALKQPGIKVVFNDLQVVHVPDGVLSSSVVAAIEKDQRDYTIYDLVHVFVEDGQVYLSGHARDAIAAEAIAATASKVRGAAFIENDIETTPMSPTDEELQSNLVSAINRALTPFQRGNASIHVMVKDGHVSLGGFVDEVEARRAVEESVEGTVGGLDVDNNLRVRR